MCVESVKMPIKILAVEKNGTLRRLIRVNLEADGLLVCEAGSEHECWDVLQRERCRALLFSTDSLCPDMVALIQKVRQWRGEELPLLLISAEEPTTAMMRDLCPAIYLRRPFSAEQLSTSLKQLLSHLISV